VRCYDAIEAMIDGKGLGPMQDAWHHIPRVTAGHPRADWAYGWDEVLTTWKVFAAFGKEGRGGSRIQDLTVHLYGKESGISGCINLRWRLALPSFRVRIRT
jgi:hypothetical protein